MIRVRGLTVRAGRTVLVRGVDLDVAAGETLGLIGESGSGKTVTCLALLRLLPPGLTATAAAITYRGQDLAALSDGGFRPLRGRVLAMVFQDPASAFNPAKRIAWHLETTLARRGAARPLAPLLEEVGIAHPAAVLQRYPHQLSGGMLQRVLIAMELALEPGFIVADEPTTNLDTLVEHQVLDLLRALQRRLGSACVFITHDIGLAARMCDRLAVMYAGEIVETGPLPRCLPRRCTRIRRASSPPPGRSPATPRPWPRSPASCPRLPHFRPAACSSPAAASPDLVARSRKPCARPSPAAQQGACSSPLRSREGERDPPPPREPHRHLRRPTPRGRPGPRGRRRQPHDRPGRDPRPGRRERFRQDHARQGGAAPRRARRRTHPAQRRGPDPLDGAPAPPTPPWHADGVPGPARLVQPAPYDRPWRWPPRSGCTGSVRQAPSRTGWRRCSTTWACPPRSRAATPTRCPAGQLQRAAIARALALDPALIVADEAVSKLDVSVRAQVLNLLRRVHAARGLALLFITHDLHVARFLCHRIGVMRAGRLVEIGPTEALYTAPQHEYTRALLGTATGDER